MRRSPFVQGERGTWAKMSAIQANCGIELTIDACLAHLTNALKKKRVTADAGSPRHSLRVAIGSPSPQVQAQQMLRARTPSWTNMQAYGESSLSYFRSCWLPRPGTGGEGRGGGHCCNAVNGQCPICITMVKENPCLYYNLRR